MVMGNRLVPLFEKLELRRMMAADLSLGIQPDQSPAEPLTPAEFCTEIAVAAQPVYERAEGDVASLDVNRDGFISPDDVDLVASQIAGKQGIGPEPLETEQAEAYDFDVNRDGFVSPADALAVINRVHWYNSLVPCNCAQCLANAVVDG
ncbi:MAG: hypothetical protein KDB22_10945 [Planctomycetales bacterium]|nr:hypothetical protein [Planctomycetales bacterium]